MNASHTILTLCLAAVDDNVCVRCRPSADINDSGCVGTMDRDGCTTTEHAGRRVMLIIPTDESPYRLWSRVNDSIARLAGGPVVGSTELADRIIQRMRRETAYATANPVMTLTRPTDTGHHDPYAPPTPRLELVEATRWLTPRLRPVKRKRRTVKPSITQQPGKTPAYSLQ